MANSAIRLRAMLDFESESGEKRVAGDEWLFEGPGTALSYDFGIKLFLRRGGGDSVNLDLRNHLKVKLMAFLLNMTLT